MKQSELERNAEYQRRKSMSNDDRAIISRDTIAKNLHEQNQRDGKRSTYEDAQRKATEIAHKGERIRQEND